MSAIKTLHLAALLLTLPLVSVAAAPIPGCTPAAEETARAADRYERVFIGPWDMGGIVFPTAVHAQTWTETNGYDGLQPRGFQCWDDATSRYVGVAADTMNWDVIVPASRPIIYL